MITALRDLDEAELIIVRRLHLTENDLHVLLGVARARGVKLVALLRSIEERTQSARNITAFVDRNRLIARRW